MSLTKCLCPYCDCKRGTEMGICTKCVYENHYSKTKKEEGKAKVCQSCGSTDLLPSEHSPSVIVCHNCDEVQQK